MRRLSLLSQIGFVTVNLLFWLAMIFIGYYFTWERPPFSTEDGTFGPTMLFGNLFNALVVYINALILYPYRHKLVIPYWVSGILLILFTAIGEAFVDLGLAEYYGLIGEFDKIFEGEPEAKGITIPLMIFGWTLQNIFIHTAWFFFSYIIIFFFNSVESRQLQKAWKKEKMKAELQYLKAQINPHFLFNGINSVYFLIDNKPEIAKSTLLKFSDLLRYQLYDCQDDFILLKKELDHIQSYVEMEKIRRGEDANILLNLADEVNMEQISPLLFTPFIENAFKYLSNHDDGNKNQVVIDFRLDEGVLFFEIENTIDDLKKEHKEGGIGIQNVRKRLSLLYPNKYQLDIFKRDGRFIVRLNIDLKKGC